MASCNAQDDRVLSTSHGNALLRWDNLLDVQVALFFPFELQFFLGCDSWLQARSVLDAGCGNGAYLSKLSSYFPYKTYTGLDISSEFISVAEATYKSPAVGFLHGDFFELTGEHRYDAIIMRLIVQHMRSISNVLHQASKLSTDNGSLFIIEPEPAQLINYPETPAFFELLKLVDTFSAHQNKIRASLATLATELESMPNWSIKSVENISLPTVGIHGNSLILQMYMLWIDILEHSGAIEYEYDNARHELHEWAETQENFCRIGAKIYHIGRS